MKIQDGVIVGGVGEIEAESQAPMKASRLIEVLESIVEEQGDVEVWMPTHSALNSSLLEVRQNDKNVGRSVHLVPVGVGGYWGSISQRIYRSEPYRKMMVTELEYEQL